MRSAIWIRVASELRDLQLTIERQQDAPLVVCV
jgi:hypothetical protein